MFGRNSSWYHNSIEDFSFGERIWDNDGECFEGTFLGITILLRIFSFGERIWDNDGECLEGTLLCNNEAS